MPGQHWVLPLQDRKLARHGGMLHCHPEGTPARAETCAMVHDTMEAPRACHGMWVNTWESC